MFPSIPPKEVITLVEKLLEKNKVNVIEKHDIVNLLEVCLRQNYFQFNNNIYTCTEGLIMGNPLSPLLAEIFMDNLEGIIHGNNVLHRGFLYWHRYVDDVLTCFVGTTRQLDSFLEYINSLHPNIKFTMEIEENKKLNFLDLTLDRTDNTHQFSIFHKPSHTDTTINNSSTHPRQHKHAAYHSMIHRLLNIPLSEHDFEKELNLIRQIAVNNGFQVSFIDKLLHKKQYNNALKAVYPNYKNKEFSKFRSLTFIGDPSEKISSFLKKQGLNIAYKTNNTLGSIIKNNKDKNKKEEMSGVYKLTCGTCPKMYVGQTGRNFKKRIDEHKKCFLKNKNNSTFANHLLEEQHSFNDNFEILHTSMKGAKLTLLESLEINRYKKSNNLLNDQTDINNSPLVNLF